MSGGQRDRVEALLGLTEATTKSYLQGAARKLGAHNHVEALAHARRADLLP